MSKIYVDLDVIAHLFGVQNRLELEHREKTYVNHPDRKELVRVEVCSTLYRLFCKISDVAVMSHPISAHELKALRDKADNKGADWQKSHHILK